MLSLKVGLARCRILPVTPPTVPRHLARQDAGVHACRLVLRSSLSGNGWSVPVSSRQLHAASALLPAVPMDSGALAQQLSSYPRSSPLELVIHFDGGRTGPVVARPRGLVGAGFAGSAPQPQPRGRLGAGAALFLRPTRGPVPTASPPPSQLLWHAGLAICGGSLEHATSNTAEYIALGEGLRAAASLVHAHPELLQGRVRRLLIQGDSALVIEQLGGGYSVNYPHLAQMRSCTLHLLHALQDACGMKRGVEVLRHVRRAHNAWCDALSGAGIAYAAALSEDPSLSNIRLLRMFAFDCLKSGAVQGAQQAQAAYAGLIGEGEQAVQGPAAALQHSAIASDQKLAADAAFRKFASALRTAGLGTAAGPADRTSISAKPNLYVTRMEPWLEAGREASRKGSTIDVGGRSIVDILGVPPLVQARTARGLTEKVAQKVGQASAHAASDAANVAPGKKTFSDTTASASAALKSVPQVQPAVPVPDAAASTPSGVVADTRHDMAQGPQTGGPTEAEDASVLDISRKSYGLLPAVLADCAARWQEIQRLAAEEGRSRPSPGEEMAATPVLRLRVRLDKKDAQADTVQMQYELLAVDMPSSATDPRALLGPGVAGGAKTSNPEVGLGEAGPAGAPKKRAGKGDTAECHPGPFAFGTMRYQRSQKGIQAALAEVDPRLATLEQPGFRSHADAPLFMALLFALDSTARELGRVAALGPAAGQTRTSLRPLPIKLRLEVPSALAFERLGRLRVCSAPGLQPWLYAVWQAAKDIKQVRAATGALHSPAPAFQGANIASQHIVQGRPSADQGGQPTAWGATGGAAVQGQQHGAEGTFEVQVAYARPPGGRPSAKNVFGALWT